MHFSPEFVNRLEDTIKRLQYELDHVNWLYSIELANNSSSDDQRIETDRLNHALTAANSEREHLRKQVDYLKFCAVKDAEIIYRGEKERDQALAQAQTYFTMLNGYNGKGILELEEERDKLKTRLAESESQRSWLASRLIELESAELQQTAPKLIRQTQQGEFRDATIIEDRSRVLHWAQEFDCLALLRRDTFQRADGSIYKTCELESIDK